MKKVIVVSLVLACSICFPVLAQNKAYAFEAGDTAAGQLKDGNWYLGEIEQINGPQEYVFNTKNGRQAYLKPSALRPLKGNIILKPGDKVAAVRDNGELFFGGIVEKADASGAIIKWSDGKPSSRVALNRIITGLGDYDMKKAQEPKDDRLAFSVGNSIFEVSRINGRVYFNGSHVGDYDFKSGKLSSYSSNNMYSGQVAENGNIYVYKARTMSGGLDRKGTFYAMGGGAGSITPDGTIYIGGKSIGRINSKNPQWNEMRAVVAVLAVYTSAFAQ